ncbi:alpha/beta fold hydrolase [Kutzneria albida]|uniref:AB hydrolase-1 domain-containing protein n=1 Tax=Kutzneria albida DSM 43870 TaxID=1449976 RepID=W5WRU9_9PSEU|nr:alpha/beta hydrolase [Kutzneria albida]AHI00900.1 hypothetical protein KALB_7542 [Kutzneria albida DSM 43870]
MHAHTTGFVTARSGYRLHFDSFGSPEDPALLMIMGGNAPCFAYSEQLCTALAQRGNHVVRYDHRGAGHSSPVDWPAQAYGLDELAEDAADVLTELGLGPARVLGVSTGGAVAQLLALDHAELVSGLVLIATSPDYNVDPSKPPVTGLPLPGREWVELVPNLPADPVAAYLHAWRVTVGPAVPFDLDYWTGLVQRTLALPENPAPGVHQGPAVDAAPPRTERLASLTVPTLVVHGGHDVVLPPEHGRALAAAIPGAKLVEVPELGHMFAPSFHDQLVALVS